MLTAALLCGGITSGVHLSRGMFPSKTVVLVIQAARADFDTPQVALKQQAIPDAVVNAMVKAQAEGKA